MKSRLGMMVNIIEQEIEEEDGNDNKYYIEEQNNVVDVKLF